MKIGELNKMYTDFLTIKTKNLPLRMKFTVCRNIKIMEDILADVDKQRSEAINKYAVCNNQGIPIMTANGQVTIPKTEFALYTKEMSDLLDTDVKLEFEKVQMEDVETCENEDRYDCLSVAEVGVLQNML